MSDPIRWDVSMTQDGIGRFVSYHDYAMKSEECEALRARVAELEAALAKREAVPEGFVLVPVEPTPKMVDATWGHDIDKNGGVESQNKRNRRIWSAMLAAAKAQEGK